MPEQRHTRQRTVSEASYDSRGSVGSNYSYISERFRAARRLKKAPSSVGISIDSDEDLR